MDFKQIRVYKTLFSWYNISMKQKIKITDKTTGKTLEKEVEIPNKDHFEVQLRTKAHVFRDRTKYTRKRKHKKPEGEE